MPRHFFVLGAQRCGTTYLYNLLDAHPEIEMARPLRPEPKFFLDEAACAAGLDHYERAFFSDSGTAIRGEKGTSYLERGDALCRIAQMIPDANHVVILRDPVRRAISHYRFSVENGVEDLPLEDALKASISGTRYWDRRRFSVSPFAYLPRGEYVTYLRALMEVIPRARLHVLLLEELLADLEVIADLYARLGADPSFRPATSDAIANASSPTHDPVAPATVDYLRSFYRGPNHQLVKLLGRPLPWPG